MYMQSMQHTCLIVCLCVHTIQSMCGCPCVYMPHAACLGPCTFTSLCVLPEAETLRTGAAVATRAVLAPPVVTEKAVDGTLVHIYRVGWDSRVRSVQQRRLSYRPWAHQMLTYALPARHACLIAQVADASVAAP